LYKKKQLDINDRSLGEYWNKILEILILLENKLQFYSPFYRSKILMNKNFLIKHEHTARKLIYNDKYILTVKKSATQFGEFLLFIK